jgi:type 1 glutamine amidotransferase
MNIRIVILALLLVLGACRKKPERPNPLPLTKNKVLLYTETAGYRHESISAGTEMFKENAEKWNLEIQEAATSDAFTVDNLKQYRIIVFMSTTGDLFTPQEEAALQAYVKGGGAILGIHAASDAEYDWPWYGQMLGGWFIDHPAIQEAKCMVKMPAHESVKDISSPWIRTDEWYNFKNLQQNNQIVLTVDESSYTGGTHGAVHPISWYRTFDGGRIFYTAMGHTPETYKEELFIRHIGGAISWLAK